KTADAAAPAVNAPTVNLYTDPGPPDPETSVHPGVLSARSAVVLAGTVSVSTTPVAFVPVPSTTLPKLVKLIVYGSTPPRAGVTFPSVSDTPSDEEVEASGEMTTRSMPTVAVPLLTTLSVCCPAPRPASV